MNEITTLSIYAKTLLKKTVARFCFVAEVVDIIDSKLTCSVSELASLAIGTVSSLYKIPA